MGIITKILGNHHVITCIVIILNVGVTEMDNILFVDPKSMTEYLQSHGFYLGGSRYFNKLAPELIKIDNYTDWDLYGQDSPENRELLENLGFILYADKEDDDRHIKRQNIEFDSDRYWHYKGDDLLVRIYGEDIDIKYSMQVLLRTDANLYKRVFENMTPNFFHDKIWKGSGKGLTRKEIQTTMNKLFKEYDNV